jgi:Uma2 family endonuclease
MVIANDDIHRFTVDEYLALVGPGDPRWEHTELIEGFVYDMSPEHVLHARTVWAIGKAIEEALPELEVVPGGTVRLDELSLPAPDVIAFAGEVTDELAPLDGRLVRIAVEVSVATLAKDLGPKLRMYARAGVPEYWVVVPADGYLLRHTEPAAASYAAVERIELGDDLAAAVAQLLR